MSTDTPKQKSPVTRQIILFGAILTLANLANIIHKSSRVYLFQQAQCLLYYKLVDPTKIDTHYRIEEKYCKVDEIQSRLSIIDGIDSFLIFLPRESLLAPVVNIMPLVYQHTT